MVKARDGVAPAAARTELEQVLKSYPNAELQDQAELKASEAGAKNVTFVDGGSEELASLEERSPFALRRAIAVARDEDEMRRFRGG